MIKELLKTGRKIIVLDDDPTGIQTVHGVSVLTQWEKEDLLGAFFRRAACILHINKFKRFNS